MRSLFPVAAGRQRGLTLVEFMVAIALGMLLVAAIATLIANQSTNRAEIDRSGKMIENGRYALQAMAQDIEMAGYWGELGLAPAPGTALPDPCATTIAGAGNLHEAMALHVQGYDSLAVLPANLAACVKNFKPGTDVLVVRHAEPDTSAIEAGGVVNWSKLTTGQVYLQTGVNTVGVQFSSVLAIADGTTDSTTFNLKRRDKTTPASPRRYSVHIYFIAKCSVEVSGSCTNGDGGNPIPTLKRVDLGAAAGVATMSPPITIAEGIENMQIDYGLDNDGDGSADGADTSGSAFTVTDWPNVMTLKIHLQARSTDKTPGFTDTKSYSLGTAGASSAPVGAEAYRRHVFVQSVRMVNPTNRRAL